MNETACSKLFPKPPQSSRDARCTAFPPMALRTGLKDASVQVESWRHDEKWPWIQVGAKAWPRPIKHCKNTCELRNSVQPRPTFSLVIWNDLVLWSSSSRNPFLGFWVTYSCNPWIAPGRRIHTKPPRPCKVRRFRVASWIEEATLTLTCQDSSGTQSIILYISYHIISPPCLYKGFSMIFIYRWLKTKDVWFHTQLAHRFAQVQKGCEQVASSDSLPTLMRTLRRTPEARPLWVWRQQKWDEKRKVTFRVGNYSFWLLEFKLLRRTWRKFLSAALVAVLLLWSWVPVGSLLYLAMKPEDISTGQLEG